MPERPRRRVERCETVGSNLAKSGSEESGVELPPVPKTRPSRKPLAKSATAEKSVEESSVRPAVDVANSVTEARGKLVEETLDKVREAPVVSPVETPGVTPDEVEEAPEELEEQIIDLEAQSEGPCGNSPGPVEPVDEPVERPVKPAELVEEPKEEVVVEPIEESTEKPIEKPIEEPVEMAIREPGEKTIREPGEKTIEEPVEKMNEEPIEKPIEEPIEKPIENITEEPVEETGEEEPKQESTETPTEKTTEKNIEAPIVAESTQELADKGVAPQIQESPIPKQDSSSTQAIKKLGKAPPVPRKPSSKIAAFQQMFQQQPFQTERTSAAKDTSTSKNGGFSGNRAQFAQNLNGMIALPGMAQVPPAFAKKLGATTSSDDNESTNDDTKDTESETALPEIPARSKRTRGPAKRLPKTVASIKKVEAKPTFNIKVVKAWSISFKPDLKQKCTSEEQETDNQPEQHPRELIETEEPASGASTDFEDSVEVQLQPETIKESFCPQLQLDTEPVLKADLEQEQTPMENERSTQEQHEETLQDDPILDADESTPTAFIAEAYDEDTEVETPTA